MTELRGRVVLVAGGARVDAGKTTFSTGLLARLRTDGYDPLGIKPRAGNDYWFDHDDVRSALSAGRLYGSDARRLAAASEGDRRPESINPIHRLWRPTPGRTGLLGESDRTFLVDRVGTGGETSFVVNGAAAADGLLPDRVRETLPIGDAPRVDSVDAFNDVMGDRYVPPLNRLADRVADAEAPTVVESYGDVAVPLDVPVDAVAVVAPGQVRIYDGERYGKARRVAGGSAREGRLEEPTDAVTELMEPLAATRLPALAGDVRTEPSRVADAYREAYDALLGAV